MKRLDLFLVEKKIFSTREKAKLAIRNNAIMVEDKIINIPSKKINEDIKIKIVGKIMPYVSKGGLKLEKAIKEFCVSIKDKIILDIGSSTGGFTDCCLKNNAKLVYAIDVGINQLADELKKNPKVISMEETDFRELDISLITSPNIVTIDISFISLNLLVDKLNAVTNNETKIICLIKPQFECGKEIASKYKGVINNKQIHIEILNKVIADFASKNFTCLNLTFSPIKGKKGNIEYLALFQKHKSSQPPKYNINEIVDFAYSHFD